MIRSEHERLPDRNDIEFPELNTMYRDSRDPAHVYVAVPGNNRKGYYWEVYDAMMKKEK